MRIVDKEEYSRKVGRTGLNSAERFIIDVEENQARIVTLLKMDDNKQAEFELSELRGYGSRAAKTNSTASSLNKMFIIGELPLLAISRKDKIVVQKLEQYNIDSYPKADRKPMSDVHTEILKAVLIQTSGVLQQKTGKPVKEEKPKKK